MGLSSCLWVEVNSLAFTGNLQLFRQLIGSKTKIMAVVKANAYGHGLVGTAKAVEAKVEWFGVNNLAEGLELRKAGIQK